MQVNIRQCDSNDLDVLLEIATQTFDDTFRAWNTEANFEAYLQQAFTREKFSAELAHPHSAFYFICAGGCLAGYIKLNVLDAQNDLQGPDSLEIERIYVKKEFQGRGLGKKLIEFALKIARQSGKKFAWLGVWEKNEKAIGFYQSLGFHQAGTHGFILGEDYQTDNIMKIDLNKA
jgi:ribosomal protein S18 acetylase RimI-like enzyme